MVKDSLYKIMRFGVILNFLYLFFFENVWDIDGVIKSITNCLQEEVIYFKIVIIIICVLLIYIIKTYLKYNFTTFLYTDPIVYIKTHKKLFLFIFMFLLWSTVLTIAIICEYKKYIVLLLGVVSIIFSGCLGFIIGRKPRKEDMFRREENKEHFKSVG